MEMKGGRREGPLRGRKDKRDGEWEPAKVNVKVGSQT